MIIKRDVNLYKLDENGYFIDYEMIEVEIDTDTMKILNVPEGYVEYGWSRQEPERRWFTPKYDKELSKWVESLSDEEIEEFNKPVEIEKEVKNEEIKKQLLDLQNYIISKEYANLINVGGKSNAL